MRSHFPLVSFVTNVVLVWRSVCCLYEACLFQFHTSKIRLKNQSRTKNRCYKTYLSISYGKRESLIPARAILRMVCRGGEEMPVPLVHRRRESFGKPCLLRVIIP